MYSVGPTLGGIGVALACISLAQAAMADDLSGLTGDWAASVEACKKLRSGGFESTAAESGQIMSITGNTLTWTRGSCALSVIKSGGGTLAARTECEHRSRTSNGTMRITMVAKGHIVLEAKGAGHSGSYFKCD